MLPGGRVHPSSAYFLHPNQWENLARFPRDIFPSGETLLGSRGTFSRAGKPCSVPEEHFPGRGNLAAIVGNVFPSGKTLSRSWGTFSRTGKPCRARGERFPERGNLAALRGNTFTSMETMLRFAAGFQRQFAHRHHSLFAHIRAYRIRPPHGRTRQKIGISRKNESMLAAIIPRSPLQLAAKNKIKLMGKIAKEGVTSTPSFAWIQDG